MNYGRYFFAQIKRIKRLLPEMLFLSILFFAVTLFVGKTLIAGSDYEAGKLKYRIGVMGEEDEFIDILKKKSTIIKLKFHIQVDV